MKFLINYRLFEMLDFLLQQRHGTVQVTKGARVRRPPIWTWMTLLLVTLPLGVYAGAAGFGFGFFLSIVPPIVWANVKHKFKPQLITANDIIEEMKKWKNQV